MRLLKKICLFMTVIAIAAVGTVTLSTETAEAKATPKLSKKSVMIAKGGSQTIKLKNGKGKWSVKKNGVVRIKKKTKKSITLVPVKPGKTVVSCKVKGKKLKCKVRVLNNRVGSVNDDRFPAVIVGEMYKHSYYIPAGYTVKSLSYNSKLAKIIKNVSLDPNSGESKVTLTVKGIKSGRVKLNITYANGTKAETEIVPIVIISDFRGKAKAKKTDKNYKAWRTRTISRMVSADMTTWEMVDAIGYLISSGRYSSKGGSTGKQLWYGGNGTCVSGAKMMNDFMKDIGVSSKIHFMGNKGGATDIYGYSMMYMSQHKNTWIKLGGKRYELNPQPGMPWPLGIVRR